MAISEQGRLATVEEHVRGENARDMDAVMRTFSDGEQASVVYNGIPTRGRAKIRRSYEIRLNALPDFRFEVKQRHFSADSLIAGTRAALHQPEGAASGSAAVHCLL